MRTHILDRVIGATQIENSYALPPSLRELSCLYVLKLCLGPDSYKLTHDDLHSDCISADKAELFRWSLLHTVARAGLCILTDLEAALAAGVHRKSNSSFRVIRCR